MNAPTPSPTDCLNGLWHVAARAEELPRGEMLSRPLLGQSMLLGRDRDGVVFALRDFCPHRGIPLRYGSFDGSEVECCYHGWRFDTAGQCTSIPSLAPDDKVEVSRIKCGRFDCAEEAGLIWVRLPNAHGAADLQPAPPPMPVPIKGGWRHVESVRFPCAIDHAVIGLMDPAHGPFVHQSWWWRTKRSLHLKAKHFAPTPLGFRMVSHKPSSNSRAYRILLGGEVATEISFALPALRTEHIRLGAKHHILLLTALTPVGPNETVLHQFIATTLPWLNALLPLLKPFGKRFIAQDLDIVIKQQEGLQPGHPSLMLLGDADQQALWYFRLKKAWNEAQASGEGFVNKVPEKLLRWRS